MLKKFILIVVTICASSLVWADSEQCKLHDTYVKISKKHDLKAYDTPSEIYLSGARCAKEKGDAKSYKSNLFFASLFQDPMSLSQYAYELLYEDMQQSSLVLLAAMSESKHEVMSFNAKFLLGLYFSAFKDVVGVDYLTRDDLRVYGKNLLLQASEYEFGYKAHYFLAAIYKAENVSEWKTHQAKGDEMQKKHLGYIQSTCSESIKEFSGLNFDMSLLSQECSEK